VFEKPQAPVNSRAIVERILRGDRTAEEELAQVFLPRIHTFVGARTRDRELSLEVGQETILAVVCAARDGKIRDPESLPAFIYGTARNLMNDALRRRSQERLEPISADVPEPETQASHEDSERLREAHRAIIRLDSRDRHILLLTLVDGLKPGAIAAKVGLSSIVVRQRKRRALKRVMELMKPQVTKPIADSTNIGMTGEPGK
jgi:RNA polymerase sigma-70 factor (ECF subfamily)